MITSTIVNWEEIPIMLENGWEIDIYSDDQQEAIMSIFGEVELDEETNLPIDLQPKRGRPVVPKPKPNVPRPPMHNQ